MNTSNGTKGRRTFWTALGAMALVIGSSASAHAVGELRTTPTLVGAGKVLSCNISNVGGTPLRAIAIIMRSDDPATRRVIPNGVVAKQGYSLLGSYQVLDPFVGFMNFTAPVGSSRGFYSCYFALYKASDGSQFLNFSDIRAGAEVYSPSTDSVTATIPAN